MCAPNNSIKIYEQKLIELHGAIDESTILDGDVNVNLSRNGQIQ